MTETTHRVISLGAGVQSSTILMMANSGELEPRPDVAVFADTGWEPADVYDHLDWLESVSDTPVVRVSNGRNLREDTANWREGKGKTKMRIPVFLTNPDGSTGMVQHRQCTHRYKIMPIEKHVRREMLGLRYRQRTPSDTMVEMWLGISSDEPMRMRDSRRRWQVNRYPLIELNMTRMDCVDWFSERYPERILPRSACSGCPFRSDSQWLHLKRSNPGDFAETVKVDSALRVGGASPDLSGTPYLHQRRKPLAVAVEEYERELAMNPMLPGLSSGAGNECAGVCFV